MSEKIIEKRKTTIFLQAFGGLFLFFGLLVPAFGQVPENTQSATAQIADKKSATTVLMPLLTEFKGVKIGSTAEEVRDKLGKAKIDDKDGFFYDWDDEMAQIRLGADKKVQIVSITYLDGSKNMPKYADIFGAEDTSVIKPDGSVYNLVRYPDAGYWVAYSRTAGEKPQVTVTMQKL